MTYEGPALTSYIPGYISPVFQNVLTPTDEIQGKTWIMTWKNVDFPEDGQYDLITKADDLVIIRVDGIEVGRHNLGVDGENFKQSSFNATKGKRTLELELSNLSFPNTGFPENPVYTSVEINKNVSLLRTGSGKSWDENPIGVGAILIPPPCPRKISGKGVVTDIIPTSPGNGYLPPVSPLPPPPSTVSVTPSDVPGAAAGAPGAGVGAPGAGVGAPPPPGVSPTIITIVPPSGAPTGINARFIPQFEVVRDPIVVNPQQLLQVTDLVGLKQTGYVNGRPYYGSVYYDRGIRYAGFYETVGEPVRVYDTLRESITAQVTTSPSAILRQGTDIRSNDPLLNIPGTVQSTLSSNSIVGAGDISTPSVPFTQEPIQDPVYPVSLRLKRVLVEDPGINYNVTDKIRVIPSNGAILEPVFGSFGRVIKVAVINPGFGFTEYPQIEMYTPL